jgi:hypothetical protein
MAPRTLSRRTLNRATLDRQAFAHLDLATFRDESGRWLFDLPDALP